ncbi:MAG TPA: AAA family ATPase, partial [Polyangiales bacterium]|nr:AAA family ATPase [Polyangiales bacterium]
MAPEQVVGAAATTATDLYATGVMLFQALTGQLPFQGSVGEMLGKKQYQDAPRVLELAPEAPPDLAELCEALLEREPARRPSLTAALRGLGDWAEPAHSVRNSRIFERERLIGRAAELAELQAAYAETLGGKPVVVFVQGESGMGKSALISSFLDAVQAEGDAAVLSGRCYEQESVPFKAFDAVVDDLSRYLRKLSREAAGELMPREVFALSRLFPVLDRVEAISQAPRRELSDPHELQQRAFAAFAELLARIRDRRPLVLYIDDLQWTCRDSCRCMAALLSLPEPPPLLLLASHRSEHAEQNALLQDMRSTAEANRAFDTRTIRLSQLSEDASAALA